MTSFQGNTNAFGFNSNSNMANNNMNAFGFNSNNNLYGKTTMKHNYANANLDEMNTAPRCPVMLLVDTSGSMDGAPINELNAGIRQFIAETADDEAASMSVELEVITFDNQASVAMPFTPICDVDRNPAPLVANGMTCMGEALRLATHDLHQRRKMYRNNGISSYKPWVVLMTDGGPNDDWINAAEEMRKQGESGKIQYIGIEIGNYADHNTMLQILPAAPGPVKLQGLKFKQFFRWLTDSLRSVSSSTPAQENSLQFKPINSWADLVRM